ncbi:MAG TPA: formate dehydrogenase [Burkholderiaceae bacterium]|nr:formate dehydrogenase [Burkholderiaceae bacterium]
MKPANQPASVQSAMHRRKLLGAAGTTGALAAAATLLATRDDQSVAPAEADAKAAPARGGGYRLTEHVQRYYQTTKV